MLRAIWKSLKNNELGQDVAEYCLITALLALVALGIFYHAAGGMAGIWASANASLAAGNTTNTTGGSTGTARTPIH